MHTAASISFQQQASDPPKTRTWNLRLRRPALSIRPTGHIQNAPLVHFGAFLHPGLVGSMCFFSLVGRMPAQQAGGRRSKSHRELKLSNFTLPCIVAFSLIPYSVRYLPPCQHSWLNIITQSWFQIVNTLPERLELPTLRLTASRSNRLS